MWRELGILVLGGLIGFFGNMLLMAYTVNRKLDQVLLRLPHFITDAVLEARLTKERHDMRGEYQEHVGRVELNLIARVDGLDERVRDLETKR